MMEKEVLDGLEGNDRFEGYCYDLIQKIATMLKFEFTITLVPNGTYGSIDANGEWNGMIRQLRDRVSCDPIC